MQLEQVDRTFLGRLHSLCLHLHGSPSKLCHHYANLHSEALPANSHWPNQLTRQITVQEQQADPFPLLDLSQTPSNSRQRTILEIPHRKYTSSTKKTRLHESPYDTRQYALQHSKKVFIIAIFRNSSPSNACCSCCCSTFAAYSRFNH